MAILSDWISIFLSILFYFLKTTKPLPQQKFEPQRTWEFAYARS